MRQNELSREEAIAQQKASMMEGGRIGGPVFMVDSPEAFAEHEAAYDRVLRAQLVSELIRTRLSADAGDLISEAEKLYGYIKYGKPA